MDALIRTNKKVARLDRQRETEGKITFVGNLTLYVRSDGNDANSGQSNDAAGAFATIQRAIDVACLSYEGSGSCTIQVQDGTWSLTSTLVIRPNRWAGGLVIRGNTTTPASCILQGITDGMWIAVAQYASDYISTLKGFKVQRGGAATNINAIVCRLGGVLFLENMDFGAVGNGTHMVASDFAELAISGAYTVSGSASYHMAADINSYIATGGATITFSGSPTIGRWAVAQRNSGVLHRGGGSLSGAVTISTEKYLCQITAFVEGIANMPGAGGTLAWGGQAL